MEVSAFSVTPLSGEPLTRTSPSTISRSTGLHSRVLAARAKSLVRASTAAACTARPVLRRLVLPAVHRAPFSARRGHRLAGRGVLDAELQRVHPNGLGHHVHLRLDGEGARWLPRGPQRTDGDLIGHDLEADDVVVRTFIKPAHG